MTHEEVAMRDDETFHHRDRCAISGIGWTDFSRDSGRSELTLATQASLAAIADAGLTPQDIDGIVRCDMDLVRPNDLVDALGMTRLDYYGDAGPGGVGTERARSPRRWPRSSPGWPPTSSSTARSTGAAGGASGSAR